MIEKRKKSDSVKLSAPASVETSDNITNKPKAKTQTFEQWSSKIPKTFEMMDKDENYRKEIAKRQF